MWDRSQKLLKAEGKVLIYLGHVYTSGTGIVSGAACQDTKRLLETRILSLGMTIFSIWLLCTDTIPGRQREL